MDAFTEILSGVKLSGALFFVAEFFAPWGFAAPASSTAAALLAPGAAHLVLYDFVIDGGALAQLTDGQSVELKPGDIVIFPHRDAHQITSVTGAIAPFPDYGISAKIQSRDLRALQAGGGGDTSRIVRGYMTCDPHLSRPIRSGLPPLFKVNVRSDRSGQWLEHSIMHLVEEAASGHVGSEAMLSKLSEALFVDTLRRYIGGLPSNKSDGSPERAIPSSARALVCYTPALLILGRWPISRNRWGFHAPLWWSASRAICPSRR